MIRQNESICRKILSRFPLYAEWTIRDRDKTAIWHARRAALHSLALLTARRKQAGPEQLRRAVQMARLAVESPADGTGVEIQDYYQTLALLLLRAVKFDPSYQAQAYSVIKMLREEKYDDRGLIVEPEVLAALRSAQ